MTSFFSTSEFFTSEGISLGVVIAFTAPIVVLASSFSPAAGQDVSISSAASYLSLIEAMGGSSIEVLAVSVYGSTVAPSTGSTVGGITVSWATSLLLDGFAAGGMAGLFNDRIVEPMHSTSQFSTALYGDVFSTVRTINRADYTGMLYMTGGKTIDLSSDVGVEPYYHGPSARPYAVKVQVIMS